jgi:hypothetical protein
MRAACGAVDARLADRRTERGARIELDSLLTPDGEDDGEGRRRAALPSHATDGTRTRREDLRSR